MSKLKKIISPSFYRSLPDRIIMRSNWYKNIFEDAIRINQVPQHLDIINFGSNPAKFGFDYSECELKGYNLAVGPQTLTYDFNMLNNFHSCLDENGPRLLLLLFCPFSLCKDFYIERDGSVYKDLRYYPILHRAMIRRFDEDMYEKWVCHPRKLGLRAYYHVIRHYRRNKVMELDYNPLTPEQMRQSAKSMIKSWQYEFFLQDLNPAHLSAEVRQSLKYNERMLDEIILFCKERDIHPTLVLPPLSPELNELIPQDFREVCIYSIMKNKGILFLDYTTDERFCKEEYFLDALRLNKKGRIAFTNQVVNDLKSNKQF